MAKFLRRCEPEDADVVYRLLLANAPTSTLPIENWSLAQFREIYDVSMYYFWSDQDDVYALVNLSAIDPQSRSAEFGVLSLRKRTGNATDACLALFAFAFKSMGMNRLWCRVNADNEACLNLIRKTGILTQEGALRQVRFRDGRFVDQLIFSVLAQEQWAIAPAHQVAVAGGG